MIMQGETIKALIDTGSTFSVLNITKIKGSLPQSNNTSVQMVGVSKCLLKLLFLFIYFVSFGFSLSFFFLLI